MVIITYKNSKDSDKPVLMLSITRAFAALDIDEGLHWLQSLKQFFINVSYHILVASLTLMALF